MIADAALSEVCRRAALEIACSCDGQFTFSASHLHFSAPEIHPRSGLGESPDYSVRWNLPAFTATRRFLTLNHLGVWQLREACETSEGNSPLCGASATVLAAGRILPLHHPLRAWGLRRAGWSWHQMARVSWNLDSWGQGGLRRACAFGAGWLAGGAVVLALKPIFDSVLVLTAVVSTAVLMLAAVMQTFALAAEVPSPLPFPKLHLGFSLVALSLMVACRALAFIPDAGWWLVFFSWLVIGGLSAAAQWNGMARAVTRCRRGQRLHVKRLCHANG